MVNASVSLPLIVNGRTPPFSSGPIFLITWLVAVSATIRKPELRGPMYTCAPFKLTIVLCGPAPPSIAPVMLPVDASSTFQLLALDASPTGM